MSRTEFVVGFIYNQDRLIGEYSFTCITLATVSTLEFYIMSYDNEISNTTV